MAAEETRGASGSGFTLLGDQPYSAPDDPLGFQRIVEGLETLVLGSRDSTPFTLGIEGSWGTGKSTLMGALRQRLAKQPEVTAVSFNAWTAEDGRVLEGFVKTVLNEIDPNILRRTLRNQKALRWTRALATLGAGPVGLSNAVDKVWDQVAADPQARNELRDLVEETVEAWRSQAPELGDSRLLCVFVDDLDRCYPRVVLEVLEAMKLYLDVPGIVFVVGYDEDIVSDVVLRDKGYGDKTEARGYLEKFIQISYRIPRADETESGALIEEMLESSGTGRLLGETERRLVVEGSRANPRRIKRFINGFVLVYELDPRWRRLRPESLVRVLLLQMYFPEFARLLEDPSERDPAAEFLEYEEARSVLRRGSPSPAGQEKVEEALESHQLRVSGDDRKGPEQLLDLLERHVPGDYPRLAERSDFVALIRSLHEGEDWQELRESFFGGVLARLVTEGGETLPRASKYSGLRVLWVDDEMENNQALVSTLRELAAEVVTAGSEEEMLAELERGEFDVMISDIARGDEEEVGLSALERLKRNHPRDVPEVVMFFVSRITPAREERAHELGAGILRDSQVLLDFLFDMARRKR